MAKATRRVERREETQAEQDAQAMVQVMGAVAQHKDALLTFLDILGEMHEAGLLTVMQGLLKNRQQVGLIGLNQLNKSGAQHTIKNGMSAVQFLGQVNPDQLKQMLNAVVHGLEHAQPSEKSIGLFGMVGAMRDRDVNTSLSLLINFLRGMGEGLHQTQTH